MIHVDKQAKQRVFQRKFRPISVTFPRKTITVHFIDIIFRKERKNLPGSSPIFAVRFLRVTRSRAHAGRALYRKAARVLAQTLLRTQEDSTFIWDAAYGTLIFELEAIAFTSASAQAFDSGCMCAFHVSQRCSRSNGMSASKTRQI